MGCNTGRSSTSASASNPAGLGPTNRIEQCAKQQEAERIVQVGRLNQSQAAIGSTSTANESQFGELTARCRQVLCHPGVRFCQHMKDALPRSIPMAFLRKNHKLAGGSMAFQGCKHALRLHGVCAYNTGQPRSGQACRCDRSSLPGVGSYKTGATLGSEIFQHSKSTSKAGDAPHLLHLDEVCLACWACAIILQ